MADGNDKTNGNAPDVVNTDDKNQDNPNPNPPNNDDPPKSGAVNFYKEQANAFKSELQKMKEENQKLANAIEESKFKSLQEKDQHKELAEAYREKYESEKRRVEEFSEFVTHDKKMSAIKQEAMKQGIDPSALRYLEMEDFSSVQVETTSTGNFNVLGVQEAIEAYKLENKLLFTDNRPPTINNTPPGTISDQNYTADQIIELQKKNPKEYQRIVLSRLAKANRPV